jgi:hypothetical protein
MQRGERHSGWLYAAVAVSLVLAGAGGWWWHRPQRSCAVSEQELAGVWDEPRRETLRQAFLATRQPYAESTWRAVEQQLGRYLQGWQEARAPDTGQCPVHRRALHPGARAGHRADRGGRGHRLPTAPGRVLAAAGAPAIREHKGHGGHHPEHPPRGPGLPGQWADAGGVSRLDRAGRRPAAAGQTGPGGAGAVDPVPGEQPGCGGQPSAAAHLP